MESIMRQVEDSRQNNGSETADPQLMFYLTRTYQVLLDVLLISTMLGRRRRYHAPQATNSLILINLLADLAIGVQM